MIALYIGSFILAIYLLFQLALFIWLKSKQRSWYKINAPLGRELGYPECCIKAFCNQPPELMKLVGARQSDYERYEAALIDGQYSGFIPCHKCATKVLSGEIKLHDLVKNRSAEMPPFPHFGNNPDGYYISDGEISI